LEGEINICSIGLSGAMQKRDDLIARLSSPISKFQIYEDNQKIFESSYSIVEDISFDESDYAYSLPFSISLTCHDDSSFSGYFFVKEPKDSYVYKEDQNGTYSIERSISCVGIASQNVPAIENAKNWVYSRTGLANAPAASYIYTHGNNDPILTQVSENVDRLGGSYAFQESYVFDQLGVRPGVLRYIVECSYEKSDQDDVLNVSMKGTVDGGLSVSRDDLLQRAFDLDSYSICSDYASVYVVGIGMNTGEMQLSTEPQQKNINHNPENNQVQFEFTYSSNNTLPIIFEISQSISKSYDPLSHECNVKFGGSVRGNRGDLRKRFEDAKANYPTASQALAMIDYTELGISPNGSLTLNGVSYSEDKKKGGISFEYSWFYKDVDDGLPCGILDFSYSATKKLSINQYGISPSCCGSWIASCEGVSPCSITFEGSATAINQSAADSAKAILESIGSKYMALAGGKGIINRGDGSGAKGTQEYMVQVNLSTEFLP
jgi:hypothetical protein